MRAVFVRHGSTDDLEAGRIQSSYLGRLSEQGRREATVTQGALREEKFSRVFIADSERARETADIVLEGHVDTPRRCVKWLCERNYGDLVGWPSDEAVRQHNESPNPVLYRPCHGESLVDTWRRVRGSGNTFLWEKLSGEHVLFVGHGTVFKCLLMALENVFPERLDTYLSWGGGSFKNCSITRVLIGWSSDGCPKTIRKMLWNDVSHLS